MSGGYLGKLNFYDNRISAVQRVYIPSFTSFPCIIHAVKWHPVMPRIVFHDHLCLTMDNIVPWNMYLLYNSHEEEINQFENETLSFEQLRNDFSHRMFHPRGKRLGIRTGWNWTTVLITTFLIHFEWSSYYFFDKIRMEFRVIEIDKPHALYTLLFSKLIDSSLVCMNIAFSTA